MQAHLFEVTAPQRKGLYRLIGSVAVTCDHRYCAVAQDTQRQRIFATREAAQRWLERHAPRTPASTLVWTTGPDETQPLWHGLRNLWPLGALHL